MVSAESDNQDFRFLQGVVDAARRDSMNQTRPRETGHQAADEEAANLSKRPGVHVVEVDYKENRCVLFKSSLLHETAPLKGLFRPAFTARRINLTFMFGISQ